MSTSNTTTVLDPRQQRGLAIATRGHARQKGGSWTVRSESEDGEFYSVDPSAQRCTCPDHTLRRKKCKHLWAVEFSIKRETTPDGSVTLTKTLRVTYRQNWPAYNAAQTEEKTRFAALLADLVRHVPQLPQTTGRPRLPLADMIFACAYKVYCGFSSRRFMSDLASSQSAGYIGKACHFNSVSNYMVDPALTPILKQLVTLSSLPLKPIERDFAVDSSGFTTSRFVRWFNKKYGREIDNREWVKLHVMCGVTTQIVTSVEISGWAAHDSPYFRPLVEATAEQFQIREVLGDKAYASRDNMALVEKAGATPYIAYKVNTVMPDPADTSVWARMYHLYSFQREPFLQHYHQRSNVETAFSMMKAKFGDSVRSKSDQGQINEVLCKVLCHNICCLIQSIHELGIDPTFCSGLPVAQEVAV